MFVYLSIITRNWLASSIHDWNGLFQYNFIINHGSRNNFKYLQTKFKFDNGTLSSRLSTYPTNNKKRIKFEHIR